MAVLTDANTPATLVLRYAANLLGAVVVHLRGVNAAFPQDQLPMDDQVAILSGSDAVLLAVDPTNAEGARALCARLPGPPRVGVLGAAGDGEADLTAGAGRCVRPGARRAGRDGGGDVHKPSTGRPKGVCWPFAVRNERAATLGRLGNWERYLFTAPLTHTSGQMADGTIVAGGTAVLMPGFEPQAVLRAIATHRITHLTLAAPQVLPAGRTPGAGGGRSVEHAGAVLHRRARGAPPGGRGARGAGVAAGADLRAAGEEYRPDLPAHRGRPPGGALHRTVGRPVAAVEVRVCDPQDGRPLPAKSPARWWSGHRGRCRGTWRAPDRTARALLDGVGAPPGTSASWTGAGT